LLFFKRIPSIRKYNKDAPIILVATKIDIWEKDEMEHLDIRNLSKKEKKAKITTKEGKLLAKKINANEFIECSALSRV
jgi:GTPase SAR1 family protein